MIISFLFGVTICVFVIYYFATDRAWSLLFLLPVVVMTFLKFPVVGLRVIRNEEYVLRTEGIQALKDLRRSNPNHNHRLMAKILEEENARNHSRK